MAETRVSSVSGCGCGAWGGPSAAPTWLRDVMDAELSTKLQREEREQWEREIAGRFGSGRGAGWCFVEVPSGASVDGGAGSGGGVMSVVQQEIAPGGDADLALALELEAHEAEEYDRLQRQQELRMERFLATQEEDSDVEGCADMQYTSDGQLVAEEQSEEGLDDKGHEWLKPLPKRQWHDIAPKQRSRPALFAKAKGKRSRRHTKQAPA